MPSKSFGNWRGVDARPLAEAQDMRTLRSAINVDLLNDGSLVERDGLRLVATVHSESKGLYSIGGSLRAAAPAGHSLAGSTQADVPIVYDFIGDGTVYGSSSIARVASVSTWGSDPAYGLYPYLVIELSTGVYEHHWCKDTPVPDVNGTPPPAYIPSADPVSTKITLPFTPGESVLKIQEKMCAIDNVNGTVRFCSTLNGVEDWDRVSDAGFLPVLRHVTGDRTIRGLSYYDSMMAVAFEDSIQLWEMNPDPARHQLIRVLNGPGIQYPGSMANVRGDLFYFSRGAFSALKVAGITGQLTSGDIGAEISPLTESLAATRPIGLWSQARSAYYCAFGSVVWRYISNPRVKMAGWTKYELPVTVDNFVEHQGELYIRSGTSVYRFERGYDDGSSWTVDLPFFNAGTTDNKLWQTLDLMQRGSSTISGCCTPNSPTDYTEYMTVDGINDALVDLLIADNGRAISLRFTGDIGDSGNSEGWMLDGVVLSYVPSRRR